MGILIKSIVQNPNVKAKRVRISEDELAPLDSFNRSTSSQRSDGDSNGNGIGNRSGGLVRRNAIRGRWLRRLRESNRSNPQLHPSSDLNPFGDRNSLDLDHERFADVTAGIIPAQRPPDHRDLEGMTLDQLENRANELRRTLDERHNIRFDLPDDEPGMTSHVRNRQIGNNSDLGDANDNDEEDRYEVVSVNHGNRNRSGNSGDGEDPENQRSQSLMFEIRRRAVGRTRQRQRRRRRRVRGGEPERVNLDELFAGTVPQSSREPQEPQIESYPEQTGNTSGSRSHLYTEIFPMGRRPPSSPREPPDLPFDEYDLLVNGPEPSNSWRNRTIQIHRANNNNTRDPDQYHQEESAELRRQRNRNSYVILENGESSASSDSETPLEFDAGHRE